MALVKSKQSGKLSKLETMLKAAQGLADDSSINTTVSISLYSSNHLHFPLVNLHSNRQTSTRRSPPVNNERSSCLRFTRKQSRILTTNEKAQGNRKEARAPRETGYDA